MFCFFFPSATHNLNCIEASKFSYDVGTIYSYDYTAEAASKVAGTSDEESRLHISAVAAFEVVSPCELILRVRFFIDSLLIRK